jgi:7-cyano-7-deazaguanine synthase
MDGTPAFVEAIGQVMALQEGALTVEAPAIGLTTVELVRRSAIPHAVLAWAHSCHRAQVACGQCRGCNKYFDAWRELNDGVDPAA